MNNNKVLAHSRRDFTTKVFYSKTFVVKPVKKCGTYRTIVLFADYKFIISTKDKIQIERLIFKRDINDVPYTCES